jgi:hypothetical protein
MGGSLFLSLANRQSYELADGKPPQNFNKSRDSAQSKATGAFVATVMAVMFMHKKTRFSSQSPISSRQR